MDQPDANLEEFSLEELMNFDFNLDELRDDDAHMRTHTHSHDQDQDQGQDQEQYAVADINHAAAVVVSAPSPVPTLMSTQAPNALPYGGETTCVCMYAAVPVNNTDADAQLDAASLDAGPSDNTKSTTDATAVHVVENENQQPQPHPSSSWSSSSSDDDALPEKITVPLPSASYSHAHAHAHQRPHLSTHTKLVGEALHDHRETVLKTHMQALLENATLELRDFESHRFSQFPEEVYVPTCFDGEHGQGPQQDFEAEDEDAFDMQSGMSATDYLQRKRKALHARKKAQNQRAIYSSHPVYLARVYRLQPITSPRGVEREEMVQLRGVYQLTRAFLVNNIYSGITMAELLEKQGQQEKKV